MNTFTVRSVLEWTNRAPRAKEHIYEERITIWNADSLDEAIALAEKEEAVYAQEGQHLKEGMVPLGLLQAFEMFESIELKKQGVEVFSLLRESDLEPDEYLDTYFDTGTEHEQEKEDTP